MPVNARACESNLSSKVTVVRMAVFPNQMVHHMMPQLMQWRQIMLTEARSTASRGRWNFSHAVSSHAQALIQKASGHVDRHKDTGATL